MPILYTASNSHSIAFALDPGQRGVVKLLCSSPLESELRAIQYGLNSYFVAWQKELDARKFEGEQKVSTPSDDTKRKLPDAVEIRASSLIIPLLQLGGGIIIPSAEKKIINNIYKMLVNVPHKYTQISESENKARRLLII